jgi:peroxiredoxin
MKLVPRPQVGDPAPDVSLLDLDGVRIRLSRCWGDRPAVLVFLRYFGCPFCQAQVVGLRDERASFQRAGAEVVLVGQGTPEDGSTFLDRTNTPFTCLIDTSRAAYRAYDLGEGGMNDVLGPRVAFPFLRANLRRETRQRGLHGGSFWQMPGTFVVGEDGIVYLAHRNRHIADSPSNRILLSVLGDLRVQPDR